MSKEQYLALVSNCLAMPEPDDYTRRLCAYYHSRGIPVWAAVRTIRAHFGAGETV